MRSYTMALLFRIDKRSTGIVKLTYNGRGYAVVLMPYSLCCVSGAEL